MITGTPREQEPAGPDFYLALREEKEQDVSPKVSELVKYDKYFPDNLETHKFNQKSFTRMMLSAVADLRPDTPFKMTDDETIAYTDGDGEEGFMSLHNIWQSCKVENENRRETLRNWLHTWDTPLSERFEHGTLVPAVRFMGSALNSTERGKVCAAGIELAEHIQVVFVLDSESGISYLASDDERLQGADYKVILSEAVENLRNVLPPVVGVFKTIGAQSWMLKVDNNYEASLILFDDVMSFIEKEANGNLIFCVPTRELLLCAQNENSKALKDFAKVALDCFNNGPYGISPHVYSWKNGAIEIFLKNT